MAERATRPLNNDAVQAADDDLYAKHADDPRPNALYDEDGNRKPLSATDPDQADLRQEWMDAYKANGGETESTDNSGAPADQTVLDCDQRETVGPVIVGDAVDLDESDVPDLDEDEDTDEDEPAPDDEDEPEPDPDPIWEPMARTLDKGLPDDAGDSGDSGDAPSNDAPDSDASDSGDAQTQPGGDDHSDGGSDRSNAGDENSDTGEDAG